jgi:hypothetical protein
MIFSALLLSAVGLVLVTNMTNPLSAGHVGILVTFTIIYVCTLSILLLLVRLAEMIYRLFRSSSATAVKKDKVRRLQRQLTLIMIALSFVPIFLISLNSIGQLGFKDIALIIVIEALLIFYITRRV